MEDSLGMKEYTLFYSVGIFGFVCSITSINFIFQKPILHNAFGHICAAHSTVEAAVLGIVVLSGLYSALSRSDGSAIIGHICIFCYYAGLYLHLLKSINRFCAIVFALKYRIWFSQNIAKAFIFMAFLMGFAHASPLFWHECNAYFSSTTYYLATRTFECESTIIFYDDFITCCTTMSIAISCDIIAFTYYRLSLKKTNAKSRYDYKLALHAYLTTLLYLIMICSFYLFSRFATNRWTLFLTTTFAWISCHASNELSFIIFVKFLQRKTKTFTIPPSS